MPPKYKFVFINTELEAKLELYDYNQDSAWSKLSKLVKDPLSWELVK